MFELFYVYTLNFESFRRTPNIFGHKACFVVSIQFFIEMFVHLLT